MFAIDRLAERRDVAAALGAMALGPDDAVEIIREATSARMIECVVNHAKDFPFSMGRAFIKGLTFRIGTCSVPEHWPELIPLIQNGRLKPERWISLVLPLCEGPRAYALFDARADDARADGALKMVLLNSSA